MYLRQFPLIHGAAFLKVFFSFFLSFYQFQSMWNQEFRYLIINFAFTSTAFMYFTSNALECLPSPVIMKEKENKKDVYKKSKSMWRLHFERLLGSYRILTEKIKGVPIVQKKQNWLKIRHSCQHEVIVQGLPSTLKNLCINHILVGQQRFGILSKDREE